MIQYLRLIPELLAELSNHILPILSRSYLNTKSICKLSTFNGIFRDRRVCPASLMLRTLYLWSATESHGDDTSFKLASAYLIFCVHKYMHKDYLVR